MEIFGQWGVAQTFYFAMIKAGSTDLAKTADWTPVTADANIVKDGGATAQCTNTIAYEDDLIWSLGLTAAEMQATRIGISIEDSATKAVEDNVLIINTLFSGQIQANKALYVLACDDGTFSPTATVAEFTMVSPHLTEEADADQFNGRLLTGTDGASQSVQTAITDSELANSKIKLTYTAVSAAATPVDGTIWVIT